MIFGGSLVFQFVCVALFYDHFIKEGHNELKNAAAGINGDLMQVNQDIDELRNKSERLHNETVKLDQAVVQMKGVQCFKIDLIMMLRI